MAYTSKYFVAKSTSANFIDLELSAGTLSMQGEDFVYSGSNAVDAVFVRPGLSVDLTNTKGSADKIYLEGNWADYAASATLNASSVMTISRGSGATAETIRFAKTNSLTASDVLVFRDGVVSSYDIYTKLTTPGASVASLVPSSTETSQAPLMPSVQDAVIKAIALDAAGEVFAGFGGGRPKLVIAGSTAVDTVYVKQGSQVDATNLKGGKDIIYFTGNWADYSKSVDATTGNLTFSRNVDGQTEQVLVAGGSTTATKDQLTFADGSVVSDVAKAVIVNNTSVILDTSVVTPGLMPTQIKVSGNYVEVSGVLSSLVKLVPTATSAGLVFDVQLDSAVGQFDAMNIDFSFNASKLAFNDTTTLVNNSLVADKGLAGDMPNTVSIGAYSASTPFDPTQTHSVANLGFTWASGVSGPTGADSMHWHIYLTRGTTNVQTVLDVSQDISFRTATSNGGTATGTAAADQFIIGGGTVVVTGGGGADQFVPLTGQVDLTIQDFVTGVDKIDMGRLLASIGYSSLAANATAAPSLGVASLWPSGTTAPTVAQISGHDLALDNKIWATYDGATKHLDLFADRVSATSQVDIAKLSIQFGSSSTGFAITDLLLNPYSSGPVI